MIDTLVTLILGQLIITAAFHPPIDYACSIIGAWLAQQMNELQLSS